MYDFVLVLAMTLQMPSWASRAGLGAWPELTCAPGPGRHAIQQADPAAVPGGRLRADLDRRPGWPASVAYALKVEPGWLAVTVRDVPVPRLPASSMA